MDDNQRLALIVEAVAYCQHVRAMGMPANCYSKALREPIHFLWERRAGAKHRMARHMSLRLRDEGVAAKAIYDHSIPFRYLQAELLALNDPTPVAVRTVLDRHGTVTLISPDEDVMLRRARLAHTMPSDWDGIDPLARYRAIGIEIVQNPNFIEKIS